MRRAASRLIPKKGVDLKMAKKKERKRIKGQEFFNYKKKRGDRTDGWRVHANDPMFDVIPHAMPERCDAQIFFEEELETEALDNFVRKVRRDESMEMTDLSRLAVVMAAAVRAFSRYPKINRFCAGRKIYARDHFCMSLTMKKGMSIDAEEANIKPHFMPNYTLKEVYDVLMADLTASKASVDNSTDSFVDKITSVPQWVLRALFRWIRYKDSRKGLPNWLHGLSPFHTSIYVTDIGSTGINSVYHHIYNIGTTSIFISIGKRGKKLVMDDEGNVKYVNTIKFCYVVDERICDGFYYAKTVRYITHLLKHPEELLERPETITEDPLC